MYAVPTAIQASRPIADARFKFDRFCLLPGTSATRPRFLPHHRHVAVSKLSQVTDRARIIRSPVAA